MNVLFAVFKRNFLSYFTNPTGYLFICGFVLFSSLGAFWPNEFFNANLCNLNQLDKYFPFIMLFFIPAITMSIWADERRQGTDELLLTIPAGDGDIVLGKYLAAVAIYTVSLLFSLVCNFIVLKTLGNPDLGLFLATYFGYWLIGLAMLSIGMVASFLTSNITIAFLLGGLFNAPLVFAAKADVILGDKIAAVVKEYSISGLFADFGRGVVSLAGVAYFLTIVLVMLYLSMVLIGRRHWYSGRDGAVMAVHYTTRAILLALIAVGLVVIFSRYNPQLDMTREKLSSLSPDTRKLLKELKIERPVRIEAFISRNVPDSYVETKLNLMTMLRTLKAYGGNKVQVQIRETEPFTDMAARAEKRYGIEPQQIPTMKRGTTSVDAVFMGVAMSSGLQKVIVPFINRGIPVEYELARSLATVCQKERKRVGVLATDATIFGRFNMQTMSVTSDWPIIEELKKQYEVVRVDPTEPITEKYDVLLAVQPSSLGPQEMDHFIAAIESGQPTAIFEDPLPFPQLSGAAPPIPGTSTPRHAPSMGPMGMFGGRQPPPPKGDIARLWRILGVKFKPDEIIWQDYNPIKKATLWPNEFVFVDKGSGADQPFNEEDPISSKLQHMLLPYPGSIREGNTELEVTPLLITGPKTGTIAYGDLMQRSMRGESVSFAPDRKQKTTNKEYVLAVHIRGRIKPDQLMADDDAAAPAETNEATTAADDPPEPDKVETAGDDAATKDDSGAAEADAAPENDTKKDAPKDGPAETADEDAPVEPESDAPPAGHEDEHEHEHDHSDGAHEAPKTVADEHAGDLPRTEEPAEEAKETKPEEVEINVVLVADLDMLSPGFFLLREQGPVREAGIDLNFDNVTFVLNVLDALAEEERFLEIRKRRPKHRTLTGIERVTREATEEATKAREECNEEFEEGQEEEQKKLNEKIEEIENRKGRDRRTEAVEKLLAELNGNRRLAVQREKLERKRDEELERIETKLNLEIRRAQDWYKFWAVVLPPIPPLLVALGVFITRRLREREGVSSSRLR